MFKLKVFLRLVVHASLGLVAALYIAGCQPSVPSNTQLYEVNGAQTCDHANITSSTNDDCNNSRGAVGYYYNPGSRTVFYRSNSGSSVLIEQNAPAANTRPGSTVPLQAAVVTDVSGSPLMSNGAVVKGTPSTAPGRTVTTAPVRSTASFNHPSLGRVTAGKTTSVGRGMSFGGRGASG
jgi:hypothetical protein